MFCILYGQRPESIGTPPANLEFLDLGFSDHSGIVFTMPASVPKQHPGRTITFRNIRRVSAPALSAQIATRMATAPTNTTVDGLLTHFNAAISLSLDSLVPQHNPDSLLQPSGPLVHS